jgi:hypothetical protein
MSFCANCGRQREGTARFCGGCGTEYAETADEQASPPGATRLDLAASAASGPPEAKPDPFAAWYQPRAPQVPLGGPPDGAGEHWQPTETVQATPARAGGYAPSPMTPATPAAAPYVPGPPLGGPERGGRRGLFIAVAVVVVLAAGGGAYALASSLGKHPAAQPTLAPGVTASASAASQPSASSSTPATTPSASVTPTPSAALSLVSIAPGVSAGSAGPQVETLLSHYFPGINTHDYAEYASTLNPAEQARQSQSTFTAGYGTTSDSKMTLTSLTSNGSGLTATVTFTSRQAASQSVDNSRCNDWTLSLYLVPHGSGYLIGPAPSGYQPNYSDC